MCLCAASIAASVGGAATFPTLSLSAGDLTPPNAPAPTSVISPAAVSGDTDTPAPD